LVELALGCSSNLKTADTLAFFRSALIIYANTALALSQCD
jgi:hypothetical protein